MLIPWRIQATNLAPCVRHRVILQHKGISALYSVWSAFAVPEEGGFALEGVQDVGHGVDGCEGGRGQLLPGAGVKVQPVAVALENACKKR